MLYIRTDINNVIATGHMMRCLAIAEAAINQNEEVVFIMSDENGIEILESHGYQYIILHTEWNSMDDELPVLEKVISERNIEKILVDSYQVTKRYLEILKSKVKVIYIDDINAFSYPVNAIICYTNYWKRFSYLQENDNIKLLLGSQYIPLRVEFNNCKRKIVKTEVENLLLLSGGTDNYDILEKMLDAIDKRFYHDINVICGSYYSKYDFIFEKYNGYDNIHIHKNVSNIKYYMDEADLAISAGGTTLYELCACGTPTISYSVADNQLENVRQFQEDMLIDYAGDVRTDNIIEKVGVLLKEYCHAKALRQERSLKMQTLVDGKGAQRIIEAIINL